MYAIVSTGGKQYKVATDDVLNVEKIDGEVGTKVTLPVVFLNDGKKIVTDPAKGHRQQLTRLKITKVQATTRARKAAATTEAAAEAPAAE